MFDVYDNGEICLGRAKDLIKYIVENCDDKDELRDLLECFEDIEDDDIVALNYDHGMGYSMDWWTKDDKVN